MEENDLLIQGSNKHGIIEEIKEMNEWQLKRWKMKNRKKELGKENGT